MPFARVAPKSMHQPGNRPLKIKGFPSTSGLIRPRPTSRSLRFHRNGAEGGIRTPTLLRASAPQAGASASSATTAQRKRLYCSRARKKEQGEEENCGRITLWSVGALLPLLTLQIPSETSCFADNLERKSGSPAAALQKTTAWAASRVPAVAVLLTAVPQAAVSLAPVSREPPESPSWAQAWSTSPR